MEDNQSYCYQGINGIQRNDLIKVVRESLLIILKPLISSHAFVLINRLSLILHGRAFVRLLVFHEFVLQIFLDKL